MRSTFNPSIPSHTYRHGINTSMAGVQRDMNRLMDELAVQLGAAPSDLTPRSRSGGDATNILQSTMYDVTSAQTITEKDGQKLVNFHFDLSGFEPEEIEIKTTGQQQLLVKALHNSQKDGHSLRREYHRVISIPDNVKVADLKSVLSPEGMLSVSAPMVKPAKEEPKKAEARKENVEMSITHE